MINLPAELIATYQRDGAVLLPQLLDRATLDNLSTGFAWNLAHPTPSACEFYDDEAGDFYQDLCHPEAAHVYRDVLEQSVLADVVAQLWGTDKVWFLYEQVFLKQGPATRRTPWHQDTPYLALDGEELAVVWINFDDVSQANSLEFVRGSHRQTLYNGSAFDPDDDTLPIYSDGLPQIPPIEAEREQWDIVSWPITAGDVVIFHPSTLHGGAPTVDNVRRRTLSLRFFGADAVYAQRPAPAPAPLTEGLHQALKPGQPFRHAAFPQLRPQISGFEDIPNSTGHARALKSQIQADTTATAQHKTP